MSDIPDSVDYMRVYQIPEDVKTRCDPGSSPTQLCINKRVNCLLARVRLRADVIFPLSLGALPMVVRPGTLKHTQTRTFRCGWVISGSRSQGTVSRVNVDNGLLAFLPLLASTVTSTNSSVQFAFTFTLPPVVLSFTPSTHCLSFPSLLRTDPFHLLASRSFIRAVSCTRTNDEIPCNSSEKMSPLAPCIDR